MKRNYISKYHNDNDDDNDDEDDDVISYFFWHRQIHTKYKSKCFNEYKFLLI